MVFCAYCGKSFTRKEHLERHIPSHTNVKPHRCSACQLSFARRDLLQRHHSTYHEARDPMEPLPGGIPTVAGRTPIACQNCANAKTGCDKRVPCSRCSEKNLQCAARFARRSSKAAARAAQASAATATFTTQLIDSPPHPLPPLTPALVELDQQMMPNPQGSPSPGRSPLVLDQMVVGTIASLDMCFQDDANIHQPQLQENVYQLSQRQHQPQQQQQHEHKTPPAHSHAHPSPHDISATLGPVDMIDDFAGFGTAGEFVSPDATYQDLIWSEYPMEMDMYANPLYLGLSGDIPSAALMPPFSSAVVVSDNSSSSEPMTISSSSGSMHTRDTSFLSAFDHDASSGNFGGCIHNHRGSSSITHNGHPAAAYQSRQSLDFTAVTAGHDGSTSEFDVVIASEAAWPLARCNPPIFSGSCPRTAIVHLECLEQKSKQEDTWLSLEQYLAHLPESPEAPRVIPLTSRSREKMLAIMQSFLHKALEIHRGGIYPKNKNNNNSNSNSGNNSGQRAASPGTEFNFFVLPPSRILEYFLHSYIHSLALYYPLISGGLVDPNEMLDNSQASTLLVLLMVAQGAASVPMAEARYLSAGLTETCRISLFDIIEKNAELSADPTALRCALLFTLLGAWGGDKWQMDIAMGQRGMYLSMLKHAGMLEAQYCAASPFGSQTSTELQWRSWVHCESQNRLVYNWVMVDQELSLFHDTAPVLSISDIQCPLPSPDHLWLSPTSDGWATTVQSIYGPATPHDNTPVHSTPPPMPSLCQLFHEFLNDNLAHRKSSLTPQQLRLLLHPLQSLLYHLRQMLSCMSADFPPQQQKQQQPSSSSTRPGQNGLRGTVTRASTLQRLEEVQTQLENWYELCMAYSKTHPHCAVTQCNMVLYHLIALQAVTDFAEIERLARRESLVDHSGGTYWNLSHRHGRCIFGREEAIFHSGQVLRLLRQMPVDSRPSWWSAALYRATLILWADCVCQSDLSFAQQQQQHEEAAAAASVAVAAATAAAASTAVTTGHTVSLTGPEFPFIASRANGSGIVSSSGASPPPCLDGIAGTAASPLVAIDQAIPEDTAILSYVWGSSGAAVLAHDDGSPFTLDKSADILAYAVERLNEAVSTRFSDGIRRKLLTLASNWSMAI